MTFTLNLTTILLSLTPFSILLFIIYFQFFLFLFSTFYFSTYFTSLSPFLPLGSNVNPTTICLIGPRNRKTAGSTTGSTGIDSAIGSTLFHSRYPLLTTFASILLLRTHLLSVAFPKPHFPCHLNPK